MNILSIKGPRGPYFLNLDHMIRMDVHVSTNITDGLAVTFKFTERVNYSAELTEDLGQQLETMGFSV